jgi:phage terminase large subunit
VQQVNWADNPWFPEVLELERQKYQRTNPDDYDNIWEGKPKRAADGAIYRHEIDALYADKRVCPVPYDPQLPVHTVWDLGFNDSMVVGFVQKGIQDIRVIDHIEDSHRTLDWYVGEIEKRKFRWGTDFLPHDGRTRNFQTGKSTEELLRELGRKNVRCLSQAGIEEGISAARMLFPKVYFDEQRTVRLVESLKRYRRDIPSKTGEPGAPLHDAFSHSADMFRYIAMSVPLMTNNTPDYEEAEAPDWRL